MRKAINLYNNVLCNGTSFQSLPPQAQKSLMESYQNCTRRLHCNLSVLTYIHEKYHGNPSASSNKPSFPIIMSPPQDMPELNQFYSKLQELYPEAIQFLKLKIQQMRQKQFQNQGNPSLTLQQQSQFQQAMNQPGVTTGMNTALLNPGMNPGMNPGLNQQGMNLSINQQGMNLSLGQQNLQFQQHPQLNQTTQNIPNQQPSQQPNQQNFPASAQMSTQNNMYSPVMNNNQNKPSQNFQNQYNGFNSNGNNTNIPAQAMSPQQILQQANNSNQSSLMDYFQ